MKKARRLVLNNQIRGWNECLITYIMAASSPQHTISKEVYDKGWANSSRFRNDREFYRIKLPLRRLWGPLFTHYSFMGLDPHHLKDRYADYWEQNLNHVLINYKHCVLNPKKY